MKEYIIDLSTLVNPPHTNLISGREFGEQFARNMMVLEHIEKGEKIIILIDESVIKAINDSFIKGFFSSIFEKYKKMSVVQSFTVVKSIPEFVNLFEKNWLILDSIYGK